MECIECYGTLIYEENADLKNKKLIRSLKNLVAKSDYAETREGVYYQGEATRRVYKDTFEQAIKDLKEDAIRKYRNYWGISASKKIKSVEEGIEWADEILKASKTPSISPDNLRELAFCFYSEEDNMSIYIIFNYWLCAINIAREKSNYTKVQIWIMDFEEARNTLGEKMKDYIQEMANLGQEIGLATRGVLKEEENVFIGLNKNNDIVRIGYFKHDGIELEYKANSRQKKAAHVVKKILKENSIFDINQFLQRTLQREVVEYMRGLTL